MGRNWFVRDDGSSIRSLLGDTEDTDWRERITPEMRAQYKRDGVLYIPQLLHPEWLALIEQGMRRNVLNPGYNSVLMHQGMPGEYLMDYDNYHVNPEYQYLLGNSQIPDIMQYMLDTEQLWLFHDQIFVKHGGNNMPTFWHQDLPYWIIDGMQLGSMWITLDEVPKEECLEFVPGSHLGTQYAGTTFNPDDPTEPVFPSLPRIPNIEAERDKWDIVSFDITPGDVVILHPGVLHGGGATGPGHQRRTLTIRFYGDDAVLDGRFEHEGEIPAPLYPGLNLRHRPGEPVRDPRFPRLRPLDAS